MSINIRLPNITAPTEAGKLQQMQSFMHQLVEQLNWALNNIDSVSYQPVATASTATSTAKDDPVSNWGSIKGLIIKSADIVKAYYEEIDNLLKLSGEYVAEATFPDGSATFVEKTNLSVDANSKNINLLFTDMQEILSDIETIVNEQKDVKAHIKAGVLYYDDAGTPIVGVEVGQTVTQNGSETFNRFARFTADQLAFYDPLASADDDPIAYIGGYTLHITNVIIKGSLKLGDQSGGYKDIIDGNGGIVTRWEEGV